MSTATAVTDPATLATMTPVPFRVVDRVEETADTVTLTLEPVAAALPPWQPGQFTMVYAWGVGEVPVSISAGEGVQIVHTVRAVGAVTRAICAAPVGATLGLRGPFGRGWPVPPPGADVVILAGGIGLAPLRPVITQALGQPDRTGRVSVLIGARTPEDLIFTPQYEAWRAAGAEVLVTVDRASVGWAGRVGVVTILLPAVVPGGGGTAAYVCGPEIMMRLSAQALERAGVPGEQISVSLERNMRCGIALCGHCQLGPILVCRDGPVVDFPFALRLMSTREL